MAPHDRPGRHSLTFIRVGAQVEVPAVEGKNPGFTGTVERVSIDEQGPCYVIRTHWRHVGFHEIYLKPDEVRPLDQQDWMFAENVVHPPANYRSYPLDVEIVEAQPVKQETWRDRKPLCWRVLLRGSPGMCAVSFIMHDALNWPVQRWTQPEWRQHFEQLYGRAKQHDRETGQPDCELDEKRQALKLIAHQMGVEIKFS